MQSLKQWAYVLLKDEEQAWAINRITGKRLAGFQNPGNPFILSKSDIETCQSAAAIKPSKAPGARPIIPSR